MDRLLLVPPGCSVLYRGLLPVNILGQDGFVIVDNALPDTLCAMLRGEMDALLEKGTWAMK